MVLGVGWVGVVWCGVGCESWIWMRGVEKEEKEKEKEKEKGGQTGCSVIGPFVVDISIC